MSEPIETVPVEIKNWADPIKPPYVKRTSFKTWIIDPAGVAGPKSVAFCSYEPTRFRMLIQVIDVAVTVTTDSPVASPDTSTASVAPQGLYLPPTLNYRYEFLGPDAMYLNALTAVTRVTVQKEYC